MSTTALATAPAGGRSANTTDPTAGFQASAARSAVQARAVATPPSFPVWYRPIRTLRERNTIIGRARDWERAKSLETIKVSDNTGVLYLPGYREAIGKTRALLYTNWAFKYFTPQGKRYISALLGLQSARIQKFIRWQNDATGQFRRWYDYVDVRNMNEATMRGMGFDAMKIARALRHYAASNFLVKRP